MWGGFDNANVIANRQKDTFIHGFLDVSGPIVSQTFKSILDNPYQNPFSSDNNVISYTNSGVGINSENNALNIVANTINNVAYAGNIGLPISSNNIPLGSVYVPKYANVSINANIPLGFNYFFKPNIANVFYGNITYSNTVLNATTNSNIGNINLINSIDYFKKNCDYNNENMVIPLGMSVTGSINLGQLSSITLANTITSGNITAQIANTFPSTGYIYKVPLTNTTIITPATAATVATVTVPPYYVGNSISIYTPITANIFIAPFTSLGNVGNTYANQVACNVIFSQYNNINLFANVQYGTNYVANVTINSQNINANIVFRNFSTQYGNATPTISLGTAATSVALRAKQYLTTSNITFTPIYTSATTSYTVKMYATGNVIIGPNIFSSFATGQGTGEQISTAIEYNSNIVGTTYNGYNTNSPYLLNSGTLVSGLFNFSGNTVVPIYSNVTCYSNVSITNNLNYSSYSTASTPGGTTSINANTYIFGSYSGNIQYINSYNALKPSITFNFAPNIYLQTTTGVISYNLLRNTHYANNYITTINVPNLDTGLTSMNPNYSANIVLGNININTSSAIFGNINNYDYYKLVAVGNLKLTVNNFPIGNTIANVTMYANPPFNNSSGNSIFANSISNSLNNINYTSYYPVSGNITLGNTYINCNIHMANITILDELNNFVGNVNTANYYVNDVLGKTGPILNVNYANIHVNNTNYTIKDYIGNVGFTYNLPTSSTNKTYSAYLSLNGNIETPYTTNITFANICSNISSSSLPSDIIDNNTNTQTSWNSVVIINPIYTQGNIYVNNLTAAGQITVASINATSASNPFRVGVPDVNDNALVVNSAGYVGVGTGTIGGPTVSSNNISGVLQLNNSTNIGNIFAITGFPVGNSGTADNTRQNMIYMKRYGTNNVQYPVSAAIGLGASTAYGSGLSTMDFKLAGFPISGSGNWPDITVMTLVGNGNVGIGSTTPAVTLDVSGIIQVSSGQNNYVSLNSTVPALKRGIVMRFNGTGTSTDYGEIYAVDQGTAYRNLVLNTNGGYVGIGLTNPSYALDVSGVIRKTPAVLARYHNNTQSIANNTETVIQFNTSDPSYNTNSNLLGLTYDGTTNVGRFTNNSSTTNLYNVCTQITYGNTGASGIRYLYIKINGILNQRLGLVSQKSSSELETFFTLNYTVLLTPGDYFEITTFHNCGTSYNIGTTSASTYPHYLMSRVVITLV